MCSPNAVVVLLAMLLAATESGFARATIDAIAAVQQPSPPLPPPAPALDPDREKARELYRKAMKIEGPSQEKVDLLREAATLDPTYLTSLKDAQNELADAKRAAEAKREKEQQDARQREALSGHRGAAERKHDEALGLELQGSHTAGLKAAKAALEDANRGGDPAQIAMIDGTVRRLEGRIRFRRNLLWGALGVVLAGIVLLVARLKKRVPRLEMVEGPEPGRVYKLDKDVTTIGAVDTEADLVISDLYRKISRRHCQIARSGRHFFLMDYSRNGTFVNGRAVPKNQPVLLRPNDEITLSDDVILIFR